MNQEISIPVGSGVTNAAPNTTEPSVPAQLVAIPSTLLGGDTPPTTLMGALHGAAAITVEIWSKTRPANPTAAHWWTLLGTLTIAAADTWTVAAPATAGGPTVLGDTPLFLRITAAAGAAATLTLRPLP